MKLFHLLHPSILLLILISLSVRKSFAAELSIEVIEELDESKRNDNVETSTSSTSKPTDDVKDESKKSSSTTTTKPKKTPTPQRDRFDSNDDIIRLSQLISPDSYSSIASIIQSDLNTFGFPKFTEQQQSSAAQQQIQDDIRTLSSSSNIMPNTVMMFATSSDLSPTSSLNQQSSQHVSTTNSNDGSKSHVDDENRSSFKSFRLTGSSSSSPSIFRSLRRKKYSSIFSSFFSPSSTSTSSSGSSASQQQPLSAAASSPVATIVVPTGGVDTISSSSSISPTAIDSSSFAGSPTSSELGFSAAFFPQASTGLQHHHPVFIPLIPSASESISSSVSPAAAAVVAPPVVTLSPSSVSPSSPSATVGGSSWTKSKGRFVYLKKFIPKVPGTRGLRYVTRFVPKLPAIKSPTTIVKALPFPRGKNVKSLKKPKLISPTVLFSPKSPLGKFPLRLMRFYGRKGATTPQQTKQFVLPLRVGLGQKGSAIKVISSGKPLSIHDINSFATGGKLITNVPKGHKMIAPVIIPAAAASPIKPSPESILFEGIDADDFQYPKDGEPILPSVPASDTGLGEIVEVGSDSKPLPLDSTKINIDMLKEQVKQFEKMIPESVKQQLVQQLIDGKVQVPPMYANIVASLTHDQIKSLANVFLSGNDNKINGGVAKGDKQLQDLTATSSPSESQVIPIFRNVHGAQHLIPFIGGVSGGHHFRPQQVVPPQSFEETLSVFGSHQEPLRVRPGVIVPNVPGVVAARPSVSNAKPKPTIQIVPLDGRPSGSPHLDQIEQLLSSALRAPLPAGHVVDPAIGVYQPQGHVPHHLPVASQPQVHHQVVHLNGHESPAHGQYNIIPVAIPSVGIAFPPGYVPAPFLSVLSPEQLRASRQQPLKPKFKSAYSNGWIPKDLPSDWNPGFVGTTPHEYDLSMFTASDSVTPSPSGSIDGSQSGSPGFTLSNLKPLTSTTTPSPQGELREPTVPARSTSPIQNGKQELIKLSLSTQPQSISDAISITTAPDLQPKTWRSSTTTTEAATSSTTTPAPSSLATASSTVVALTSVKPSRKPKKLRHDVTKAPSSTTTTTTTTTEAPVHDVDVDDSEEHDETILPSSTTSTTVKATTVKKVTLPPSLMSTTTTTTTTTKPPVVESDKVLLVEPSTRFVVEVASGEIKEKVSNKVSLKQVPLSDEEEKLIAESTKKHTFERINVTTQVPIEVKTSKSVSFVTSSPSVSNDPLFQAVSDAELIKHKSTSTSSPTPTYIPPTTS